MQSGVLQVEHSEKSLIEKALSEEAKKDISSDKMKKVSVQSQELLVCRDRNFIFQELLSQLVVRSRKPLLF